MVFLLTVKRPMIQVHPSKGCRTTAAFIRLLCSNYVNICYLATCLKQNLYYLAILAFLHCSAVTCPSAVLYILHNAVIKIKMFICDKQSYINVSIVQLNSY